MHITNQDQLRKQKRKLSFIFTVILFAVITGLQIVFLIGRYVDYSQREFRMLKWDWIPRGKIMETIMSGMMLNHQPPMPMPMFAGEWRWWKLKWWNMILYNTIKNNVISSSVGDDDTTKEILVEIMKSDKDQWTILYNNTKFLFSKEALSWENIWLFFMPAQTNISDIIKDSILFILVFGIFSLLFYRLIYWFVGKMFVPIEENMKDMEQFIFNAGHELKTPLSVIKSHLQLSLAKKQYKKSIDESIKEIDKMTSLLDSLVNLSVIQYDENKEPLEVIQEIESITSQYIQIAKNKWISLIIQKESDFILHAHRGYFNMLVGNLVSNAIKYNKKWGKIVITIADWMIKIQDTGIGIPQKEIEKIFDRFYQVGNVRNQEWSGIGLSLVKKIVDIYGWKIDVQSKEKQGTTFIIKF